jgi:hypothetical protein
MKKLSLKPEDLCVESFGTLVAPRARGTVRGAADTLAETCTCPDTQVDSCLCADTYGECTYLDCPDTYNPSCPRTCGIVIAYGAGDADAIAAAPNSWNCPCM